MDLQYSGLTKVVSFGVLTCNSALAVYNSWGDAGAVTFVLVAYVALVLLFLCLRELDRGGGGGDDDGGRALAGRGRIKAAVWALSTLLTVMFAARVAPLMPPAVNALVWTMTVATVAGGFWAFFLN